MRFAWATSDAALLGIGPHSPVLEVAEDVFGRGCEPWKCRYTSNGPNYSCLESLETRRQTDERDQQTIRDSSGGKDPSDLANALLDAVDPDKVRTF